MAIEHGLFHHLRAAATGGLVAQALLLLGSVVVAYLLLLPLACAASGADGLIASGIAAGICWFGSFGALVASQALTGPALMVVGVTLGMFLRMAVPLIFCLIIYLQPSALTRAGLVFYVLAFYMVTLAVDAAIAGLRIARADADRTGAKSLVNRNVPNHG